MAFTSNSDSCQTTLFRDVRRMRDVYGMGFNLGYNGNLVALEYKNDTKYYTPTARFFDLKLQAASQLKPFLGRKYADKEFQANRKFFCLEVSEGPYGYPLFHCENKRFTASQILSSLLSYLNKCSTSYQDNASCVGWCVGIPMYYTDPQRRLVLEAASQAGLNSVTLIHELTATALAYKVSNADLPKYDKFNVAFVDIGSTSMQVCIVELTKDGLKVLSQAFDSSLGGKNFDQLLYDHFVVKCKEEFGPEVHKNSRFQTRLYDACEKIKHELSVNTESFYDIGFANQGKGSVTLYINREEFVRMSASLLERVKGPLEKALSESGLALDDIHCVENVGLGSRIPEIVKIITNSFGIEPKETMEGRKLAALGCAIKSAELFKTNMKVQESFPYSISISWEVENGESKKAIMFPKGSTCPCIRYWTFYSDRTFCVDFFYSDVDDMILPRTIGTYKIGPFPCRSTRGIVPVKTVVQLNKDGIASIEWASLEQREKGKEVAVPVSKLYELKFEGTLSLLNAEVEERIQIKAELAKETSNQFKKHGNTMLNKLKSGAYHDLQHKRTNMEFTDTSLHFNATKTLLSTEIGNRTKVEEELAKTRVQLEKQEKWHETMVNEIKNEMYKESHFRHKAEDELASERCELLRLNKLYNEKLHEIEMLKADSGVLKVENEVLKAENGGLKDKNENIVKRLEEFRQWIAEQSSSTIGVVNFSEFTYSEIRESTNNFDQKLKIGEGGYGCVYKAFLRCTMVAIKIPKHESRHGEKDFNQEVEILSRIRHPNIVTLIGACPEARALVYEFIPNGSLEDHLNHTKNRLTLSWKKRIRIASNICSALIFLHSSKPHGVVHGDLKPANILIDSNHQAKITDFGLSRQLSLTSATITPHHYTNSPKGTFHYMDPEYLPSGELTPQFDVYSFGVILLQLVAGKEVKGIRNLVDGAVKEDTLYKLVDHSGKWPLEQAKRIALLGLWCSELKRADRPDLKDEVWSEIESINHDYCSH